jgi:hypothetical protein
MSTTTPNFEEIEDFSIEALGQGPFLTGYCDAINDAVARPLCQPEYDYSRGRRAAIGMLRDLREAFGLSKDEFTQCLRGLGQGGVVRQIGLLRRIKRSWESQLKPETLKQWVRKPLDVFGGKTPLELIAQGQAERVWHLLGRFQEGIPS